MDINKRFYDKIIKTESCWVWTGAKTNGYGRFGINYKLVGAHRYIYEITFGKIPKGKVICHKCDNPSCVNPDHLFIGTQLDNMRDAVNKGRLKGYCRKRCKRWNTKLTEEDVKNIRAEYVKYKFGYIKLSKKYKIERMGIKRIVTGKTWNNILRSV